MTDHLVSIVVPTWNGMSLLRPCLDSIFRQDYDNFEVIVVDCASSDGSADFVRENYPQARLIALEVDRGPTHAINLGFQEARGEYLMSVTNDVILLPDTVSILVSELEKDDNCVISPTELGWDGRYHRSGGNGFLGIYLRPFIKAEASGPFWPLVACCICTKKLWHENPFNEHFFMYEELEWGWWLHLKGIKIKVSPDALFLQKGEVTSTPGSTKQAFLYGRMHIATCFTCLRISTFLFLLPVLALYYWRLILTHLARRRWHTVAAYFHGFLDFWLHIKVFMQDRRRVQQERVATDWEMLRRMVGGIEFERSARQEWSDRISAFVLANLDSLSQVYRNHNWHSQELSSDSSHLTVER